MRRDADAFRSARQGRERAGGPKPVPFACTILFLGTGVVVYGFVSIARLAAMLREAATNRRELYGLVATSGAIGAVGILVGLGCVWPLVHDLRLARYGRWVQVDRLELEGRFHAPPTAHYVLLIDGRETPSTSEAPVTLASLVRPGETIVRRGRWRARYLPNDPNVNTLEGAGEHPPHVGSAAFGIVVLIAIDRQWRALALLLLVRRRGD